MSNLKTAIYIRVSTEEQATEGFSINAQKDKLAKYAQSNDWEVFDYYVDDGISAKNLNERPEVIRMIKDVKENKVNNVLVYKLDRLTRSVKDLIYLIELFDKYYCTFNSQTEKLDTSNAVGRMFVKIIGIFAEFERENLAERVTLGYEQKTKEGNYTNCNGVFGYDYLIGKGILKVNILEAKYVKKIYEWYLNDYSMLKIAKKLKDYNVPTKRGGQWNQSTVSSILRNPLYIGNVRYGINKKNGFEVTGKNIESLIDKDMFYNVQNLIKKRKKYETKKFSSNDTYYYKVLKCSLCGGKYHARQQIQAGKKYITYQCNGHTNNSCNAPGFSHKKIEEAFLKYLDNIENFIFEEILLETKKEEIDDNTMVIEKEIKKLNNKKKNIMMLFSNDDIDYETFKDLSDAVDIKIKKLVNEIKQKDINTIIDNNQEFKIIKNNIINIKNNYVILGNHEKKIFLERFVSYIDVKKINNKVVIKDVKFECYQ